MGRLMVEEDLVPERIISSTAVRAFSTAELAAAEFESDVEMEMTRDLYLASPHSYIEVLEDMGDPADTVMVVGHNPGISALVTMLTGELHEMPTAALAAVELEIESWELVQAAPRGSLLGFWRPKALRDRDG